MNSITEVFKLSDGSGVNVAETAQHESGHALAYLLVPFAGSLVDVEIVYDDDKRAGVCRVIKDALGDRSLHADIVCLLASMGAIHVRRHCDFSENFSISAYKEDGHFETDIARAASHANSLARNNRIEYLGMKIEKFKEPRTLLERYGFKQKYYSLGVPEPSTADHIMNVAGAAGYRLMWRYRSELAKVANELLMHRRLVADEVREIAGIRRANVYTPEMLLD